MSDSEYSSDDDEDYVPECDSASEEEVDPEEKSSSKQKSTKKAPPKRKRKGGIKLDDNDDDDNDDDDDQSDDEDLDEQERIEKEKKKQEKDEQAKKARMEDLWSAFKSDTAHVRAKPTTPSTSTKAVPSKAESTSALQPKDTKSLTSSSKPLTNKVSITKTFDFAGEAVTVTKTVDADSNEAKLAKKQESEAKKQPVPPTSASSLPLSTKRKGGLGGGLGSVLGQIGKKPKISTLEKSKLDWESFKSETGITDDLKNFNKNGYLERQDFLQRTDQRLFEREKETRAAMRSNRS